MGRAELIVGVGALMLAQPGGAAGPVRAADALPPPGPAVPVRAASLVSDASRLVGLPLVGLVIGLTGAVVVATVATKKTRSPG